MKWIDGKCNYFRDKVLRNTDQSDEANIKEQWEVCELYLVFAF
jgi:hypothetical protein